MNSCRKGKTAERRAAAYLRSLGFHDARRTEQHQGKGSAGDVECPETLPRLHLEVKDDRRVRLGTKGLKDACDQAANDCPKPKRWAVLWWEARKGWRLTAPWHGGYGYTATFTGDDCIGGMLRMIAAEAAQKENDRG